MATVTPGPGHYNLFTKPKRYWEPIQVICFYKDSELCISCAKPLLGDYYKGTKGTWCHSCYRKIPESEKCPVRKVRHCFFFHKHIGLENITRHKTTLKRVKELERKEKIMRIKFGEMVDSKNRPIH